MAVQSTAAAHIADGTNGDAAHIGELVQQVLHHGLAVGVVRPREVGLVLLGETRPANDVRVVVVEDAPGAVVGHVDAARMGDVSQGEAAQHVCTDGLNLHSRQDSGGPGGEDTQLGS